MEKSLYLVPLQAIEDNAAKTISKAFWCSVYLTCHTWRPKSSILEKENWAYIVVREKLVGAENGHEMDSKKSIEFHVVQLASSCRTTIGAHVVQL